MDDPERDGRRRSTEKAETGDRVTVHPCRYAAMSKGGAVGDNGRPEPADGVQQARPAVAFDVEHHRETGATWPRSNCRPAGESYCRERADRMSIFFHWISPAFGAGDGTVGGMVGDSFRHSVVIFVTKAG